MVKLVALVGTIALAILIVNLVYSLCAKIVGADVLIFRVRKKLITYFIVWLIIMGVVHHFFA